MELPLISRCANTPSTTSFLGCKMHLCDFPIKQKKCKEKFSVLRVRAMAEKSSTGEVEIRERESGSSGGGGSGGYTGSTMEVTTFNQSFSDAQLPVWEKIGAVVRLSYGIGIYGAMALAGKFICSISGIDCSGGFSPSLDAIVEGLGYAAPPIMALLFILDDEVVKLSPHARAIRDVEDEELRNFFYGMSPWQFFLIVAASSVGEELFYRAAVQGALADIFLRSTDLVTDARGMAALSSNVDREDSMCQKTLRKIGVPLRSRENTRRFGNNKSIKGQPGALSSRYAQGPEKGPTTRVYCTQPYLPFLQEAVSKARARDLQVTWQ